jgi:light-regulated signal transduction histidine kinase (bacteriophytochrome)
VFAVIYIGDRIYNLIISKSSDKFLLEFEPREREDEDHDLNKAIGKTVSELVSGQSSSDLLNRAAIHIRRLISYDRVMIYKFSKDDHGEVVAEAKSDHIRPLIGLHFPASDIPKQARELYKKQHTRIIADVNAEPTDIITYETQSLDLSCSELRAVSPIHIQYLKNMEVNASFSISLINKDELWGLIACHNETPKFIEYPAREAAKLVGKILSYTYEFRRQEEDNIKNRKYRDRQEKLFAELRLTKDLEEVLINGTTNIKDVINCEGAALVFENKVHLIGNTPDEISVKQVATWLTDNVQETFFCSNAFSKKYEPAIHFTTSASGIIAVTILKELGEYIMWFRPEVLHNISWAGNPDKPVDTNSDGSMAISPRKSFETWIEIVSGSCEPWLNSEVSFADKIREEVSFAVNRKAAEIRLLNEKLTYAYDELDTFSYTIAHDLRNPLAVIKSYSEILEFNKDLDEKTKIIVNRILRSARKMNSLINEVLNYSQVGRIELKVTPIDMNVLLHEIRAELLVSLNAGNLVLEIKNTPPVNGEITMISQVFNNLLSNAIKYSAASDPSIVTINGSDDGKEVIYTITDNGIGIDPSQFSKIFDLFVRLDQLKKYEGSGVGLAIVKRMVEKHKGRIWVESKPGESTTFSITFPKL